MFSLLLETWSSLSHTQDVPGAREITDLYEALDLGNVGDGHRLSVIGTQVKKGKSEASVGVQDARDLIIEMMSDDWPPTVCLKIFSFGHNYLGLYSHQRFFKPNDNNTSCFSSRRETSDTKNFMIA